MNVGEFEESYLVGIIRIGAKNKQTNTLVATHVSRQQVKREKYPNDFTFFFSCRIKFLYCLSVKLLDFLASCFIDNHLVQIAYLFFT